MLGLFIAITISSIVGWTLFFVYYTKAERYREAVEDLKLQVPRHVRLGTPKEFDY